jgi:hypothetical protein
MPHATVPSVPSAAGGHWVRGVPAVPVIEYAVLGVAGLIALAISYPGRDALVRTSRGLPRQMHAMAFARRPEVVRKHVVAQHDVVVEVNEFVGQSWYLVQMHFYRRRCEHRQVLGVFVDVFVLDHFQSRVVRVQPVRHLAVGHYVHVADPRSVLPDRTQRIAQFFIVTITVRTGGIAFVQRQFLRHSVEEECAVPECENVVVSDEGPIGQRGVRQTKISALEILRVRLVQTWDYQNGFFLRRESGFGRGGCSTVTAT